MIYLKLLQLFLSVAQKIAETIRDKQLMDAGEAKAAAKNLSGIMDTLGLAEAVKAKLAGASEKQIDDVIGENYRD